MSLNTQHLTVNSCLFPVLCCADCEITTIEGLRDQKGVAQLIIERLGAHSRGIECGYCSPALAVTLFVLLANKCDLNVEKEVNVVDELASAECKCNCGAFEVAVNVVNELLLEYKTWNINKCIEDVKVPIEMFKMVGEDCEFHRVTTLEELFGVIGNVGQDKNYSFLTHQSLKWDNGEYLVDTNHVKELKDHGFIGDQLWIGGGFTITELIELAKELENTKGFGYLKEVGMFFKTTDTPSIRNVSKNYDVCYLKTRILKPPIRSLQFLVTS